MKIKFEIKDVTFFDRITGCCIVISDVSYRSKCFFHGMSSLEPNLEKYAKKTKGTRLKDRNEFRTDDTCNFSVKPYKYLENLKHFIQKAFT